ncbi:MAG: hypothetical protein ABFS28_07020 [Bacteroidota bacterium]
MARLLHGLQIPGVLVAFDQDVPAPRDRFFREPDICTECRSLPVGIG